MKLKDYKQLYRIKEGPLKDWLVGKKSDHGFLFLIDFPQLLFQNHIKAEFVLEPISHHPFDIGWVYSETTDIINTIKRDDLKRWCISYSIFPKEFIAIQPDDYHKFYNPANKLTNQTYTAEQIMKAFDRVIEELKNG